ncbi:MAG: hypothetical protein IJL63_04955 [Clostridia bacterium]|nr:hypothetical protein [Clostridia bacterium]
MNAKFCGKCGTPLDTVTGKCPVCDKQPTAPNQQYAAPNRTYTAPNQPPFAQNVQPQYTAPNQPRYTGQVPPAVRPQVAAQNAADKNKKLIIILASAAGAFVLILLIIVLALTGSGSKPETASYTPAAQSTEASEQNADVEAVFREYVTTALVPQYGVFDGNDPANRPLGMYSAQVTDFEHDGRKELAVAHTEKRNDDISYVLTVYGCDGGITEGKTAADVIRQEGSAVVCSVPDYTALSTEQLPTERSMYTFEHNGKTYLAFEAVSWLEGYEYEAHIFTVDGGRLTEVANLFHTNNGIGYKVLYSNRLPEGMNKSNAGFPNVPETEDEKKNYVDKGYIVLYYEAGMGSDYTYGNGYSSSDEAAKDFFGHLSLNRSTNVVGNDNAHGREFSLDSSAGVNNIFSYLYYREYIDGIYTKDIYSFKDYTKLSEFIKQSAPETTAKPQTAAAQTPTPSAPPLSADEAVNIFMSHYGLWESGLEFGYDTISLAFLDMDFDGVNELVINNIGGSLSASTNHYYGIDLKTKTVQELKEYEKSGGGYTEVEDYMDMAYDIFGNGEYPQLYREKNSGQRKYYCYNGAGYWDGSQHTGSVSYGFLYLKDGRVINEPTDNNSGYEKCVMTYKVIDGGKIQNAGSETRKQLLLDSYKAFSYK